MIEAPDRSLAAGQQVAVPFKGICLLGRVLEDYRGGLGATVGIVFEGQSRVHALGRYDMYAAGEGYVLRDGTLAAPVRYLHAMRLVLGLADGVARERADAALRDVLRSALEFVEAHADEIAAWSPELAAPVEGWPAQALDAAAPGGEIGQALRAALFLAGEAVGEDVHAFVAASRDGARLHRRDDGRWVALDQEEDSPLWTADYGSREEAARSYCRHHGIAVPRPAADEIMASEHERAAYEVAQELVTLRGDELAALAVPSPSFR